MTKYNSQYVEALYGAYLICRLCEEGVAVL
jgi:hypothetical protein